MANLTHVELITPERVLFSGEAEAVVLRATGRHDLSRQPHDYIVPSMCACCGSKV